MMRKGCSSVVFFAVIAAASLYYIYQNYDIKIFNEKGNDLTADIVSNISVEIADYLTESTNEVSKQKLDEFNAWISKESDKIDLSSLEEISDEVKSFFKDKVIDEIEISKLNEIMKRYEESTKN